METKTLYKKEEPGFIKSHKKGVALSVAGLFLVGGVGAAVNGQDPEPTTAPVTAEETTKPEEPVQESPEPVEPTQEPVQEEVQPEPVTPEPPVIVEPPVVVDPPQPEETPLHAYDLPASEDARFVQKAQDAFPILAYSTPESIITVAENTCLRAAAGMPLTVQEAIALEAGASGELTPEEAATGIGVMYGGAEFYCPEFLPAR